MESHTARKAAEVLASQLVMIAETPKAIGVAPVGDKKVRWWLPKSVIVAGELEEVGDEGWIKIPRWLAENRGMAYESKPG